MLTVYLIGKYILPKDRTRIRDIWILGTIYTSAGCLLLAYDMLASLSMNELYMSISIGFFFGIIWVYLIYRYEKKLMPDNFSFKKTRLPQLIVWTAVFIYLQIQGVETVSVMLLGLAIYMFVGLFGIILLEMKFKKEIHIDS